MGSPPTGMTAGTSDSTKLFYDAQGSSTFASFMGFVKSITLPSMSRAALETTLLTATTKEFIAGIKEFGELSCECLYDSANAVLWAETTMAARSTKSWKLEFPDGAELKFDGYIKSVGTSIPEGGDLVSQNITIKLSADVAVTWLDDE